MTGTCKTCRHWSRHRSLVGVCTLITPGGLSGTHLARIGSLDGSSPTFLTLPEYGCVEHEPTEED